MKNLKATYNKSEIMKRAWQIFRGAENLTFGESLKQSWNMAKNGLRHVNFTTIYNKYYREVLYFIMPKVNNDKDLAEDLCHDTFIKASKHLERYDVEIAKLNTWLLHIAKNVVIDNFRTAHQDKFVNVSQFADAETGRETFQIVDNSNVDNVESHELSSAIEKAMSSLKPNYRRVAELFFIEEKQYTEIAEMLNIPLGSVKGMINRVRTKLQGQLQGVMS